MRRFFLIIPVCLLVLECTGGTTVKDISYRRKNLPEFGVIIFFPSDWETKQGNFFHFTAKGPAPNHLTGQVEYRGLKKAIPDDAGKQRYATGWYEINFRNYPGWKFDRREQDTSDSEGTFRFEGTYREGATIYRKIGILRFRGVRLHAIYYTAPDQDFELARTMFQTMDQMHRYYDPDENQYK